ncbi:hypothetical protein [Jiangella rhizosphaerae]|uniref:Uncharacterized protein n=1 Tax=Jiangella rhizosphaerae TaxID=2293569 RepID=A0A418KRK5_9ACTN|nr:hypothetical protein [Jiangella rhizosphaerae]RIQ25089.1 hypothetical protein DY240_11485 [Jiangella rhizosphaerae]
MISLYWRSPGLGGSYGAGDQVRYPEKRFVHSVYVLDADVADQVRGTKRSDRRDVSPVADVIARFQPRMLDASVLEPDEQLLETHAACAFLPSRIDPGTDDHNVVQAQSEDGGRCLTPAGGTLITPVESQLGTLAE